jgi:hypothetical protein
VGTGAALIANAAAPLQVTASVPVVTVTLHAPTVAPGATVILAVATVAEVTVMLLTVMPSQKVATLTPSVKLVSVPVMVT